jgi:hypothetical protein
MFVQRIFCVSFSTLICLCYILHIPFSHAFDSSYWSGNFSAAFAPHGVGVQHGRDGEALPMHRTIGHRTKIKGQELNQSDSTYEKLSI